MVVQPGEHLEATAVLQQLREGQLLRLEREQVRVYCTCMCSVLNRNEYIHMYMYTYSTCIIYGCAQYGTGTSTYYTTSMCSVRNGNEYTYIYGMHVLYVYSFPFQTQHIHVQYKS